MAHKDTVGPADTGASAASSAGSEHPASLIYAIGRVNQGIERELRAELAPLRLSVKEHTTLSVLAARPGLSNAQLARRALVAPQSMIEILAKLEQRGLVQREVDPNHARIRRSRLTPKGSDLIRQSDPAVRGVEKRLLALIPPENRAIVLEAMLAAMTGFSQTR